MDDSLAQLENLYRETAPALLAYFRAQPALAGVAEDLLHDTFVRAIRSPERITRAVTPRAYLFGIARHVGVDARRAIRPAAEFAVEPTAPPPVPEDARLETMRTAIGRASCRERV